MFILICLPPANQSLLSIFEKTFRKYVLLLLPVSHSAGSICFLLPICFPASKARVVYHQKTAPYHGCPLSFYHLPFSGHSDHTPATEARHKKRDFSARICPASGNRQHTNHKPLYETQTHPTPERGSMHIIYDFR